MAHALEAGEDLLALRLKLWLDKAFALARSLTWLAASTLARKRHELERDLDAILKAPATCDLTQAIQTRLRRARDQLLTFVTFPGQVAATNTVPTADQVTLKALSTRRRQLTELIAMESPWRRAGEQSDAGAPPGRGQPSCFQEVKPP